MSRIKGKNTKPEIYLRKLLWHQSFRYRCNYKKLPGHPDIYLKKYNTAIFVNGCFWHRHEGCKIARTPSTNTDYWMEKFQRNVERDKRTYSQIKEQDVKVVVVWECTLREMKKKPEREAEVLTEIVEIIRSDESGSFYQL